MDLKISSAQLLSAFECENIEFALFSEIKSNSQLTYKYLIAAKQKGTKLPDCIITADTSPEINADGSYSLSVYDSKRVAVNSGIDRLDQFDVFVGRAFGILRKKYKLTSKIETIKISIINEWHLPFTLATSEYALYEEYNDNKPKEIIWEYLSDGFRSIDLSYLGLKYFPPEVLRLRDLQLLNLSGNNMESVPPEICELDDLENLDLSKNNITKLPSEISRLKRLKSLNLTDNILFELPSEFCALRNLEYLEIRECLLDELPEDIGKLTKMITLDLKAKFVDTIPESIGKLRNLKKLVIENTSIKKLPDSIGNLKSLEELYIIDNKLLKALPASMCKLKNLKYLYVYGNAVKTLPDLVNQLPNIKKIYFK